MPSFHVFLVFIFRGVLAGRDGQNAEMLFAHEAVIGTERAEGGSSREMIMTPTGRGSGRRRKPKMGRAGDSFHIIIFIANTCPVELVKDFLRIFEKTLSNGECP